MARRKKARRAKRRRMSGDQSLAPSVISGTRRKRRTFRPVKRHKRRSRIGATEDNKLMKIGMGLVLGVVTGIVADKFAPESMKGKMLQAGKTLAGAGVAYAGRKNPLAMGFGLGLAANGAGGAAKEFGVVKGIEEFMSGLGADSDTMTIEMNGTPENAGKLMGAGERQRMPSVISGDEMSGMYMNGTELPQPGIISDAGDGF